MTRRWAWAEIDLGAIAHNVEQLRERVAPAGLWAVVKADGYGHGIVPVARAALDAGADGLCVALVQEGAVLRDAGVDAPVLVLSQQPPEQLAELVRLRLVPTVYTAEYVALVSAAAVDAGIDVDVHVKLDTGMQRVGAPPDEAVHLAVLIDHAERLSLAGVFTHLALADEPLHPASAEQLAELDRALDAVESTRGPVPLVHAANSAGALAIADARRSFVRAGIAMYGVSPGPGVDSLAAGLRPAMSLRARVAHVKQVRAGTHASYGWRHRFERDTTVATIPLGYADGVPRRLGTLPDRDGADVLVGGRRCPIVGVVTMDQLLVDVGEVEVAVGDEVVLIGRQGHEEVRAEHWAERLGTIGYEIVCGISARVPRVHRAEAAGDHGRGAVDVSRPRRTAP
jgi:alanine racemase